MRKRWPLLTIVSVVAAAAITAVTTVTATGSGGAHSAFAGLQAAAALFSNGFERPAAGGAYQRDQWKVDGWTADWDTGMSTRTRIDNSVWHSGSKSLRVFYPKGKIDPADSGVSAPFVVPKAREYYLSQWIRLSTDYSWGTTQFAGKLGVGLAGGASCSGGKPCDGYNGFTSRMIWRSGGRAAVYYYDIDHADQYGNYADLKLNGADVVYPRGQWVNVVQRLRVNTVTNGQANPDGEIEIWWNGRSAAKATGLRFVRNADQVDKAYFSSFFGGATTEFAPKNDSYAWYDDIKLSTQRSDICELNAGGCGGTPTVSPTAGPTTSPTTPPAGDAWAPNRAYAVGQSVAYQGARYRCLQAHTSLVGWDPVSVPALWQRL